MPLHRWVVSSLISYCYLPDTGRRHLFHVSPKSFRGYVELTWDCVTDVTDVTDVTLQCACECARVLVRVHRYSTASSTADDSTAASTHQ